MVHHLQDLFNRFPEDPDAVQALRREDCGFEALCSEYDSIADALQVCSLKSGLAAETETEGLTMRHLAVEEAILTKIEGYKPE